MTCQPGALRPVPADKDDDDAEDGADREADAPRQARVQLVEQHERADIRHQRAEPVGAVDHDVDAAPVLRRDELVDRRVHRGVLAADAHSRDEPRGVEEDEPAHAVAQGERGQPAADEVDRQRDREEVAPTEPIGQRTEHERADDLARQVHGGEQADLGGRQREGLGLGQRVADGAGDADLEAVEDPGDPERGDHSGVKGDHGRRSIRAGIRLRVAPSAATDMRAQ
jgi:hypothetical protein